MFCSEDSLTKTSLWIQLPSLYSLVYPVYFRRPCVVCPTGHKGEYKVVSPLSLSTKYNVLWRTRGFLAVFASCQQTSLLWGRIGKRCSSVASVTCTTGDQVLRENVKTLQKLSNGWSSVANRWVAPSYAVCHRSQYEKPPSALNILL